MAAPQYVSNACWSWAMKSSLNALHTLALIARVRSGEEGREGVQALLEKRSPSWLPRTDA